jgi:hypothetical protein
LNWTVVGLLAVLASCSSSGKSVCDTKMCAGGAVCDPKTGNCLCGVDAVPGADGGAAGAGVVCQTGTTCDPVSQTCVSTLCAGVVCGDTGACDPIDGTCKCGGAPCTAGQSCNQLSSTCVEISNVCASKGPCPTGLVCDPNKGGACECFLGGPACGPTQVCDQDGGCIDDPCFGVTCTASGAQCYGGICRCGGAVGVECSSPGESCSPIDNSCGPTASCAITPCGTSNTICNPNDSTCHCGTTDGPICNAKEVCILYVVDGGALAPYEDAGGATIYGQCGLNDPCKGVTCPPFETCDVNNHGACECGGAPDQNIPGTVCPANQSCVLAMDGGEPECMQNCQPFAAQPCPQITNPDSGVVTPVGCYFFQASKATVCAPSTQPDAGPNASCDDASDCSASGANNNLTCAAYLSDGGTVLHPASCLSYCNVFPPGVNSTPPVIDGGNPAPCAAGETCVPLPAGISSGICETF